MITELKLNILEFTVKVTGVRRRVIKLRLWLLFRLGMLGNGSGSWSEGFWQTK